MFLGRFLHPFVSQVKIVVLVDDKSDLNKNVFEKSSQQSRSHATRHFDFSHRTHYTLDELLSWSLELKPAKTRDETKLHLPNSRLSFLGKLRKFKVNTYKF